MPKNNASNRKDNQWMAKWGDRTSDFLHFLGLFGLGFFNLWAAISFFIHCLEQGHITIDEILLLFIFLEIGAMIGIYFKTHKMPVRFLIYIGITSLTRYLIGDISHHDEPNYSMLYPCLGILLLAISVVAVRFAAHQFSTDPLEEGKQVQQDETA